MLSAKTAHELQLSLYKLVTYTTEYLSSKWLERIGFWLLSYGIRQIPPTYPSVSLSPPFQNTGQPQLHLKE